MMKEALNRALKPEDLVIVKRRKAESEFTLGLVYDTCNSVFTERGLETIYKNCYLIENPSELEEQERLKLLDKLEAYKTKRNLDKRAELAGMKKMSNKSQKPGMIFKPYQLNQDTTYMYLGYIKLTFHAKRSPLHRKSKECEWITESEGYGYLKIRNYELDKFNRDPLEYLKNNFTDSGKIITLKSKKIADENTVTSIKLPEIIVGNKGAGGYYMDIARIKE